MEDLIAKVRQQIIMDSRLRAGVVAMGVGAMLDKFGESLSDEELEILERINQENVLRNRDLQLLFDAFNAEQAKRKADAAGSAVTQ